METTYSLALVWNLAEYNLHFLVLALLSPASLKAARLESLYSAGLKTDCH